MSDFEHLHLVDVPLADLTPDQRAWVDQALRHEGIAPLWAGTILQVDAAYQSRVDSIVGEARAVNQAAGQPAPGILPTPTSPAPGAANPTPGYPAPVGPGGPPAYGGPAGAVAAPGYGYRAAPSTNSMAILSVVLGGVSILFCLLFVGPIGLWAGLRARKEIAASGGTQGGDGLALAGVIISGIATALFAIGALSLISILIVTAVGSN